MNIEEIIKESSDLRSKIFAITKITSSKQYARISNMSLSQLRKELKRVTA